MDRGQSILDNFVMVLYGFALSLSFEAFPPNPIQSPARLLLFGLTVVVCAHDFWTFFRSVRDEPTHPRFRLFILQIASIIALAEMFLHIADQQPNGWLVAAAVYLLVNIPFNVLIRHQITARWFGLNFAWVYVAGALILGLVAWAAVRLQPTVFGPWLEDRGLSAAWTAIGYALLAVPVWMTLQQLESRLEPTA